MKKKGGSVLSSKYKSRGDINIKIEIFKTELGYIKGFNKGVGFKRKIN